LTSSTGFTLLSPVDSNFQASLGNVHLPTNVFIHCLIAAGCDTIRLKAYGQKMPMTDGFLHNEPAQTDHRWAEHNEWDIGTSFASPYIWLFASATGRRHGIKHFPMLVPGSCDYGTVTCGSLTVVGTSPSRYTRGWSTSSSPSTVTCKAGSQEHCEVHGTKWRLPSA
jgi:hypothetical protein